MKAAQKDLIYWGIITILIIIGFSVSVYSLGDVTSSILTINMDRVNLGIEEQYEPESEDKNIEGIGTSSLQPDNLGQSDDDFQVASESNIYDKSNESDLNDDMFEDLPAEDESFPVEDEGFPVEDEGFPVEDGEGEGDTLLNGGSEKDEVELDVMDESDDYEL